MNKRKKIIFCKNVKYYIQSKNIVTIYFSRIITTCCNEKIIHTFFFFINSILMLLKVHYDEFIKSNNSFCFKKYYKIKINKRIVFFFNYFIQL